MGIQKAIVAIIGAVLVIANEAFAFDLGINEPMIESVVSTVITLLTAFGVWSWPNSAPS